MRFQEQNKKKAITLSFDDGVTQDIRMIELLNKYNLKATFNLNSGLMGQKGFLIRENQRISHYKIHRDHVKLLYSGHEVAVHTLTHANLTQQDDEEVIRQVEQDRLILSDMVGYEVVGMAYPCGGVNNDDRVAQIIRGNTGIQYSRTITCTNNFDIQDNLFRFNPSACINFEQLMTLGQKFVELESAHPQIFYIWGHTFEMDYKPDNWNRMEAFFQLISGRDDIFYGTNKEVLL